MLMFLAEPNPLVLRASDPLMEVDLQILDINVCKKAYYGQSLLSKYILNNNNLLCAGSLSKINDVCKVSLLPPIITQICHLTATRSNYIVLLHRVTAVVLYSARGVRRVPGTLLA